MTSNIWKSILAVLIAIAYAVSPYDIIPDAFFGWGWLDDLIVLWCLWRYLTRMGEGSQQGKEEQSPSGMNGGESGKEHPGENRSAAGETAYHGPKDPYDLLEIDRNASMADIKKAYRIQANRYHPDKVAHLGKEFQDLAEARFKEIQQAYRALTARHKK